jgi:putative transposase
MKARYRYRIYPTKHQQVLLAQLFGCVRFVWNNSLAFCKESAKKPTNKELSKRLTEAKKEIDWLSKVSSVALQQSLGDLEKVYSNFFNFCKGKRKGKKVKPPKFKKRRNKQSARLTNNGFKLKNGKL